MDKLSPTNEREAELIVRQGWNAETVEAVLEKSDGVFHEVKRWIFEGEVVASLVDGFLVEVVLLTELLEDLFGRGLCVTGDD